MMKRFLSIVLPLLTATAVLYAEDQLEEVQIPLGGEQLKYVKLYAPSAERGRVQLQKEDGKVTVEWKDATQKSKICFDSGLFEGILADLRAKNLQPVEFVVGIRYEGTDKPQLGTYLFSTNATKNRSFFFRLKDGYAEYSTKRDDLQNLTQFQIRGGATKFTVEKLAFRVKTIESKEE